MPAKFWFDSRSDPTTAGGRPEQALKGLAGLIDEEAKGTLKELFRYVIKNILIPPNYALYMGGTTQKIRAALRSDQQWGTRTLYSRKGKLAVWYIRRAPSQANSTETIVCVAGRGVERDCYWHMSDVLALVAAPTPINQWKEMPGLEWESWDGQSLALEQLTSKALPAVQSDKTWYPRTAPDDNSVWFWHWNGVNRELTALRTNYEQNDGSKHVRSDPGHTRLYVHDDKAHGVESRDPKYAHAMKLIKAAIDLDYGPGMCDRVFVEVCKNKSKNRLEVSQIALLQREVSKLRLLDAQKFRFINLTGYPNNIQVFCSIFTRYYLEFFNILVKPDRLVESTDVSNWEYTGNKVHFSVDQRRVEDAWNLALPLLLEHHDAIKEFKVVDMATLAPQVANDRAKRLIEGAQISVYLHVAPGDEARATTCFAEVMKSICLALKSAHIGPGKVPDSDLAINEYLSFRHDLDDLIDQEKVKLWRGKIPEVGYRDRLDIRDTHERYRLHKPLMHKQDLYQILRRTFGMSQ